MSDSLRIQGHLHRSILYSLVAPANLSLPCTAGIGYVKILLFDN